MTLWNFGYGDFDIDTPISEIKGAGWQADDNLRVINSRLKTFIPPPAGVPIKMASGLINALPALARDGSYIVLPMNYAGTTALFLANASKSTVWSVVATDINAAADYWAPYFWYDNVDEALWVIVVDTGTSPDTCYLAKIDDSTGAVTNVGSFQSDSVNGQLSGSNGGFFRRAAHGAGNFTLRTSNGLEYVISSSTGAIVSGPTQLSLAGVTISDNISYQTADGTIVIGHWQNQAAISMPPILPIFRGGGRAYLCGVTAVSIYGACLGSANQIAAAIDWDDYIAITMFCTTNPPTGAGHTRFYDKTDFDRWLADLADAVLLPS